MHIGTYAANIKDSLSTTEIYEYFLASTLLNDERALKDSVSMRLCNSAEWIVGDVTPTDVARA